MKAKMVSKTRPEKADENTSSVETKVNEESVAVSVEERKIYLPELQRKDITELVNYAQRIGLRDLSGLHKHELILRILEKEESKGPLDICFCGVIEILPDGYGFIRSSAYNYLPCPDDIYVSPLQIRKIGLKSGHQIEGHARLPRDTEKYMALVSIDNVNGVEPSKLIYLKSFDELTPYHPNERFILEVDPEEICTRIIDMWTPIGKGQRGLIISPPRAGKTVLLKKIACSILKKYPEVYLIMLLIDERPEEVTEMKQDVKGEIISSCFDESAMRHIQVAELVLSRAKRMVEVGKDVVILLDSLTRLSRAYNAEAPHSGKILTGGIDSTALQGPKKFFGAARKVLEGGSLTIIATCLIDTGSKMDEVIYEEFKGTGNMELHLDRRLADRRKFPAIDLTRSGTRKEELLFHPDELKCIWMLRKYLSDLNPLEATEQFIEVVKKTKTNAEFLLSFKPKN